MTAKEKDTLDVKLDSLDVYLDSIEPMEYLSITKTAEERAQESQQLRSDEVGELQSALNNGCENLAKDAGTLTVDMSEDKCAENIRKNCLNQEVRDIFEGDEEWKNDFVYHIKKYKSYSGFGFLLLGFIGACCCLVMSPF